MDQAHYTGAILTLNLKRLQESEVNQVLANMKNVAASALEPSELTRDAPNLFVSEYDYEFDVDLNKATDSIDIDLRLWAKVKDTYVQRSGMDDPLAQVQNNLKESLQQAIERSDFLQGVPGGDEVVKDYKIDTLDVEPYGIETQRHRWRP